MTFVAAARYRTPRRAQAIYRQIEQALYQGEEGDLSAYNILLDDVPYVVVLGASPSPALETQLRRLLAAGQATELPGAGATRSGGKDGGLRDTIGRDDGSQ